MTTALLEDVRSGYATREVAQLLWRGRDQFGTSSATLALADRYARALGSSPGSGARRRCWPPDVVRWVLAADLLMHDGREARMTGYGRMATGGDMGSLGRADALRLTESARRPDVRWIVIASERAEPFLSAEQCARYVGLLRSASRIVVVPELPPRELEHLTA